ncbi:MAG: hypothetical protein GY765_02125 [bacterium]|nr:hypothetical protein [bacterium]
MPIWLKVSFVLVLVLMFPVIFYRFCFFITRVFMKEATWERWRTVVRVNVWLIITVYIVSAVGIGKNYVLFIYSANQLTGVEKMEANISSDPVLKAGLSGSGQLAAADGRTAKLFSADSLPQLAEPETNREAIYEAPVTEAQVKEPVREAPPVDIDGEIKLGTKRRFGVNWITVESGLQITRLSKGPMKRAELRIGDVITLMNGRRVNNKLLIKERDAIVSKKKKSALLTVARGGRQLFFRMQR